MIKHNVMTQEQSNKLCDTCMLKAQTIATDEQSYNTTIHEHNHTNESNLDRHLLELHCAGYNTATNKLTVWYWK